MSGVPFTSFPTSSISRFESSVFRVLLQRRLWLPLPPSTRKCRCGRLPDVRGHHRAACAVVGVLERRGFPVESAAARVCRETGARVSTNVVVRDLDILPLDRQDGRKLEVVADGLPLFHGAQLAIDTTIVSPLRADGTLRPGSHANDGAALRVARRVKTRSVLAPVGQSESKSRTSSPPGSSSSCVVAQVAHYSGMLQRKVVRDVSAGNQRRTRKRRSHSHHDGGHGGIP